MLVGDVVQDDVWKGRPVGHPVVGEGQAGGGRHPRKEEEDKCYKGLAGLPGDVDGEVPSGTTGQQAVIAAAAAAAAVRARARPSPRGARAVIQSVAKRVNVVEL